jgi:hypothetical protein
MLRPTAQSCHRQCTELVKMDQALGDANKSQGVGVMPTPFNRIWPVAGLAFGLIMTVVWMGALGYGLLKLL